MINISGTGIASTRTISVTPSSPQFRRRVPGNQSPVDGEPEKYGEFVGDGVRNRRVQHEFRNRRRCKWSVTPLAAGQTSAIFGCYFHSDDGDITKRHRECFKQCDEFPGSDCGDGDGRLRDRAFCCIELGKRAVRAGSLVITCIARRPQELGSRD